MVWYVLLTIVTTIAMEPISASIHRRFGHGIGWVVHRSHHDGPVEGWEANDLIPLVSALATMAAFWVGVTQGDWRFLIPLALGATIYGGVYFVLHDLYIHRRVPLLPEYVSWLEPIKQAHLHHHETGTGNWGILSGLYPTARSSGDRRDQPSSTPS